ncbi:MAG: hypothetical protein IJQ73_01270 [Kiritimatiellae bacterium]|nr:hypothetical protein [Kiritimatiellia bacterium]
MHHTRHPSFRILHSAFCIALAALCTASTGCVSTPSDKDYFAVRLPQYRGMVSEARRTPAVLLGAAFGKAETNAFAGRQLSVTVRDPKGHKVLNYAGTFGEDRALAFDVPLTADAPVGEYTVKAVTTDAGGRKIRAEGVFKVVPVRKGQVFVDQDGGLLADGKPWYPFGLYHVNNTNDVTGIAALGVDLCQMWSDNVSPAMVEHLRRSGVRLAYETEAWPQVINSWQRWRSTAVPLFPFETNANFRARAELAKANPDIVAFWYTSDEGGGDEMRGIASIRKYWTAFDPEDHPVYLVTTRGDPNLKPGADIFGLDCYPRSFGAKRPMTQIADLIDKLYSVYPPGNCVIAVPQAFGRSGKGKHKESPEEFACMSYLCMVHGAKGLFWYCWWDGGEQGALYDADLRASIRKLTGEAKEFKLALLVPGAVTFRSADGKVHARLCGDAETGRFLIAVNGSDDPSDGVLADPALKGLKLEPLFDTPAAQPDKDGRMKVAFKGAARAVWRVAQ